MRKSIGVKSRDHFKRGIRVESPGRPVDGAARRPGVEVVIEQGPHQDAVAFLVVLPSRYLEHEDRYQNEDGNERDHLHCKSQTLFRMQLHTIWRLCEAFN
jgi:hypothetical protein